MLPLIAACMCFAPVFNTTCLQCRYAGRTFESSEDVAAGKGQLVVKGLKSMWRQTAPIVRMTLGEPQLASSSVVLVTSAVPWLALHHPVSQELPGHAGGAVRRIIMQEDVKAAVAFVELQITRLLAGHCELWEFVMTGVGIPCLSTSSVRTVII